MVQRLIRVTKDNVVTVLIFVKVFMHSPIMIYVRSPDLIEQLDSGDSADY